MEHIVQFGVTIDDGAIQRQVLNSAEKQIIEELKKEVGDAILKKESYYSNHKTLTELGSELVTRWLNEHSAEVIEQAAAKVAEKVTRTKAWKEKFSETLKEEAANG
jgi:DNA-binding PadR family transcriptional regulator